MKKKLLKQILSLALVAALLVGFVPAVGAETSNVSWEETDPFTLDLSGRLADNSAAAPLYEENEIVRVSIVLEQASTIEAGFVTTDIAGNKQAMAYHKALSEKQDAVAEAISVNALDGEALDVVWKLSLVGNAISANVPYGKIAEIAQVAGVKMVVLEQSYEACVVSKEETAEPQMYPSGNMIGSNAAWATGYTGAGSRIAVIDTGTDTDHQSFDNGAFVHALRQNAADAGVSYDSYLKGLNLLDREEITEILPQLNAYERTNSFTAEDLYINEKLAFAYNYVDAALGVTHDNDKAGEHGSHVAGIATANRYIPVGNNHVYVDALETVYVAGVAPDAQLITMKVFNETGVSYDSDYMAAVEDAILLGCDSVNLSLGSANPGQPYSDYYTDLLVGLAETDTVVVAAAGNSGGWADTTTYGALYGDDVSMDTVGSPASYGNFLSVASVDNDGMVGNSFTAEGVKVVYTELLGYGNAAMATLDASADGNGTEYEYIFVDGTGKNADYDGIDLTGKVVICTRGGDISFAEKANNAVAKGVVATVIYNNAPGVIGLNLTGYKYTAPCVSIQKSEAAAIKAASAAVTTEGGLTYYTGTMIIQSKLDKVVGNSAYYNMSDFSSWGVPGDLSMKPEITAPGGNIYSVYGSTPDGGGSDQYELMSGTSMAAPQISGMVALVAQHIRENNLDQKWEISPRVLAQSLLMSTAEPLKEAASGSYYSILKQGAGLGRVDLAVSSETYVLVEGQKDGKVKVELGDDPQRTGEYSFSFSLYNLTDEAQDYAVDADVFRQALVTNQQGIELLGETTVELAAAVNVSIGGVDVIKQEVVDQYDLNGDDTVNENDADYLTEYLLNNETELFADGDVNGDGKVNTYDAHALLVMLGTYRYVTVPANGSVTVDVTLCLTEEAKELLDTTYADGTYVQAFVKLSPFAEIDGAVGATHTIPVLGFYGSWTDPDMFDHGTYAGYDTGSLEREPYLYWALGKDKYAKGNSLIIDYFNDGNSYYFGFNPVMDDDAYLPRRNAMNSENGATLVGQQFSLIRNAADMKLLVENAQSHEIYYENDLDAAYSAFYYTNGGVWVNTTQLAEMNWSGTDADGKKLPDGTKVNVSLVAAPAYYRDDEGNVEFSQLGRGAYLTTPITIDNTAPVATAVNLELLNRDTLTVKAKDNQYIAAVLLYDANARNLLASAVPNQLQANKEITVELDISGLSGKNFKLVICDYAMNSFFADLKMELVAEGRPYYTVVDTVANAYTGVNADGTTKVLAKRYDGQVSAAEYVDGYIYEISDNTKLYVASDGDLYDFRYVNDLDAANEWEITEFVDLAYNAADGKLYGLFYSALNDGEAPALCTVDTYNGNLDVLGVVPVDVNNLAVDGKGNFYSMGSTSEKLYTYTAADIMADTPVVTPVGDTGFKTSGRNSLAWDPNTNTLCWAIPECLVKIAPDTAKGTAISEPDLISMVGLYIRPEEAEEAALPETEEPAAQLAALKLAPGSLAAANSRPAAEPLSDYDREEDIVTVEVTAAAASTNGILEITYDAEMLQLDIVGEKTAAFAYKLEDGKVTIAYAAAEELAADASVATLTFTRLENVGLTEVTVATKERNQEENVTEAPEIVEVVVGLFDFAGTNMTLGNDLSLNFFVAAADITGEGWYAEIVNGDNVTVLEKADWEISGANLKIAYKGLSAKEMVDEVTVTVYDANGNERASKTDSIRAYAMRMFGKSKPAFDTVLADMLNYGAAAQIQFNYKTDDLANSLMTEEQQAKATDSIELSNIRETAEGYVGTTLELQSNILLNFFFTADFVGKTATVSYTDHYGVAHEYEVTVEASGSNGRVSVNKLVISDCSVPVTVTVDGISVTDSAESYCARVTNLALREPLMKFASSARAYFSN